MVINSSDRSPSPVSMRPNPNLHLNPNSRINQERELLGVRKSFTLAKSSINGQPRSLIPNTPANSPAEFARRCSFGKEGGISLQDHEKENERDPNSKPVTRVRSPSVPKMTKNFMSPTISAVSKINPSPRKKVLGERNEAIRTSASLSKGEFHFYSTGSLDFSDENGSKEDMVTSPCTTFSQFNNLDEAFNKEPEIQVTEFSPVVENLGFEPDLVVLSPEVPVKNAESSETVPEKCDMPAVVSENHKGLDAEIITCSSQSTTIASLDADPSLPPYDPKTNFLSPRPQFLLYKPNPRIESYINQGIRFEDGSSSESFSETEISEEVQSEDTFSSDGTSTVEVKSSSLELISPKSQQLDEIVEPKIEVRAPRFGGMWNAVCVIFLILLGFVAVYHENFALENFNGLLSRMSFKASEVKFSPLPWTNLTSFQEEEVENHMVKDYVLRPVFDRKEEFVLRPSIFGEEIELMSPDDYEAETDQLVEEFESEKVEEIVLEDSVVEDEELSVEMIEEATYFTELEYQETENEITSEVHDEFESEFKLEDQPLLSLPQVPKVELQFTAANDPSIEFQDNSQLDFNVEDQSLTSLPKEPEEKPQQVTTTSDPVTEASESLAPKSTEGSLGPNIAAASLLVVSLLAATTYMIMKRPKKENSITEEKSTYIPAASKIEPKVHEDLTSWSGPVEVDMMGESCPAEISSFQKTSSYNLKDSNEAQSVEKNSKRNTKRESFASSSSEYTMSSSYGSFTTYSITHSKQRDDEVVTPVRRSSRIRSKVTSP